MQNRYLVLYLAVISIFFPTCHNDSKPSEENKSKSQAIRKETVSAPALDDSTNYAAMEPVPLPKGFPPDVYLYAGAKTIKSFKSGKGFSVTLFTPDTLEKVVADYREHAELAQWQDEKVLSLSTQAILKYRVGVDKYI